MINNTHTGTAFSFSLSLMLTFLKCLFAKYDLGDQCSRSSRDRRGGGVRLHVQWSLKNLCLAGYAGPDTVYCVYSSFSLFFPFSFPPPFLPTFFLTFFLCFLFLEQGLHIVPQTGLRLAVQPLLASDSREPSRFGLPSVGISGINYSLFSV